MVQLHSVLSANVVGELRATSIRYKDLPFAEIETQFKSQSAAWGLSGSLAETACIAVLKFEWESCQ